MYQRRDTDSTIYVSRKCGFYQIFIVISISICMKFNDMIKRLLHEVI